MTSLGLPFSFAKDALILDALDLAEKLRTSRSHIYYLVRKGLIPYFRVNALIRFQAHEVEAWLTEQAGGPR